MCSTDQSVLIWPTMAYSGVRPLCPSGVAATGGGGRIAPGRATRIDCIGIAHRGSRNATAGVVKATEFAAIDKLLGDAPSAKRDRNGTSQRALRLRCNLSLSRSPLKSREETPRLEAFRDEGDELSTTSIAASINISPVGGPVQAAMPRPGRGNPEGGLQEALADASLSCPPTVPPALTARGPSSFPNSAGPNISAGGRGVISFIDFDTSVAVPSHHDVIGSARKRHGLSVQPPRGPVQARRGPCRVMLCSALPLVSSGGKTREPSASAAIVVTKTNRAEAHGAAPVRIIHRDCQLTISTMPQRKQGDSPSAQFVRSALTLYLLTVGTDSALFALNSPII